MNRPLVSVIIPSFDRPLFLRTRSIPSILSQTYTNWEAIVVGDGPVDGSLRSAVESFGDPRLRYVQIPRPNYSNLSREQFWNVAGAQARNHALGLSQGEIIAPLDDDDAFLPTHLEECVHTIQSGVADFVYGCVLVRNPETGVDYEDHFPWIEISNQSMFEWRNIMFHSSVCYSSKFAHLHYPVDGMLAADYGLWLSIRRAGGRFVSLYEPQSIYYGDALTSSIRVSVPSLPPQSVFQECVRDIFESRTLSNNGPWCERFENSVADFVGVEHAIATPSADSALLLAFHAVKQLLPERNEVILPSYSFPSTANAPIWNGLTPVFCDVDPHTLCITPESVEPLISSQTAAIVAVHSHGNPCDMTALKKLASSFGILLISDAAPAFGAEIDGQRIGSWGDIEVFSFSGTKVLSTGEGGMVCCNSPVIAQLIRRAARYGMSEGYNCQVNGINGKMGEIPAALGFSQLSLLEGWLGQRTKSVQLYKALLNGLEKVQFQKQSGQTGISVWKDLAIVLPVPDDASALSSKLASYRIQSRPYYKPLHRMPAFSEYRCGALYTTERLANCVVCIPLYNSIREEVINLVADVIKEVMN